MSIMSLPSTYTLEDVAVVRRFADGMFATDQIIGRTVLHLQEVVQVVHAKISILYFVAIILKC